MLKPPQKQVTIPYGFTPRDYQLEFLANPAKYKICVWHRRSGKSMAAINAQIAKAVSTKGIYYYVLPTYRQAKQVAWDKLVRDHIPPEIVEKQNESELAIYYKNGSIQRFVGSEDPDKLRGINVNDVIFDEFAEEKPEIWTAIFQPILRENKGTATFIFTPKGKNHAWGILQSAKENPKEWFWSVKGVNDTNVFTEEELFEIKKATPQALYGQEYDCTFLDGAGQFFSRIKENVYKDSLLPEYGDFQLGVDLAKYNDWTVITPFNKNTFKVYPQERFNQVDWNLQKARIEASARRFNNAICCVDTTGIGDPLVDDLRARGVRIPSEPINYAFKFTEVSRYNLLNNLAIMLQQDKIKIPDDPGLIAELEAFVCELNDRGKMKITVPSTMHDDRVMSLALAVWGIKEKIPFETQVDFSLYSTQYN